MKAFEDSHASGLRNCEDTERLVLGTVQLGMPYGIANRRGRPTGIEAEEIVRTAWEKGVRYFDTAQAYGDSESVLGSCLRFLDRDRGEDTPKVITKIHPDLDPSDSTAVCEEVARSLDRIGLPALHGLMIHREAWLDLWEEGLGGAARSLKERGKIRHFGVSVYSMERAFQALHMEGIDLIQLPLNVLDQRAVESGFLLEAEKRRKQVFVRSAYLQGLLLMQPDTLPEAMGFAGKALKRFVAFAGEQGVPPQLAALCFVRRQAPEAYCVLGAETKAQVLDSIRTFLAAGGSDLPDMAWLSVSDPLILNPALWPQAPPP